MDTAFVNFTLYLQEIFQENLNRLQESVSILQVEPDCKTELQEEMQRLSKLLQESYDEEE